MTLPYAHGLYGQNVRAVALAHRARVEEWRLSHVHGMDADGAQAYMSPFLVFQSHGAGHPIYINENYFCCCFELVRPKYICSTRSSLRSGSCKPSFV